MHLDGGPVRATRALIILSANVAAKRCEENNAVKADSARRLSSKRSENVAWFLDTGARLAREVLVPSIPIFEEDSRPLVASILPHV